MTPYNDASSLTSNESGVRRRSQRAKKKPNRLRESSSEDENDPEEDLEVGEEYSPDHGSRRSRSKNGRMRQREKSRRPRMFSSQQQDQSAEPRRSGRTNGFSYCDQFSNDESLPDNNESVNYAGSVEPRKTRSKTSNNSETHNKVSFEEGSMSAKSTPEQSRSTRIKRRRTTELESLRKANGYNTEEKLPSSRKRRLRKPTEKYRMNGRYLQDSDEEKMRSSKRKRRKTEKSRESDYEEEAGRKYNLRKRHKENNLYDYENVRRRKALGGDISAGARNKRNGGNSKKTMNIFPINFTRKDFEERGFTAPANVDTMSRFDTTIDFDSIGGLETQKAILQESLVAPLNYKETLNRLNLAPRKGILFHGSPGTGKTHVVRALVNECSRVSKKKYAFFQIKIPDLQSKWIGEAEKNLQSIFEAAREFKPSIIMMDEVDGLFFQRTQNERSDYNNGLVNTLLSLLDGLEVNNDVFVIGATNRPNAIDAAVRRPGRFDKEICFPLPNDQQRLEILKIHTKTWDPKVSDGILQKVAAQTARFSGADLKSVCHDAAMIAVRDSAKTQSLTLDNVANLKETSKIQVLDVHFFKALKNVSPSIMRGLEGSEPVDKQISRLQSKQLEMTLKLIQKSLPVVAEKSKILRDLEKVEKPLEEKSEYSASDKKMLEELTCDLMYSNPATSKYADYITSKQLVFQPRLVIQGDTSTCLHMNFIPSLLEDLEGFSHHKIDIDVLNCESNLSAAYSTITSIVAEAVSSSPSVIVVEKLDFIRKVTNDHVMEHLKEKLQEIKPCSNILVIATVKDKCALEEKWLNDIFSRRLGRSEYRLRHPNAQERREFLAPIFQNSVFRIFYQEAIASFKQVKERKRLRKVRREEQRKLMEEKKNEEVYESKMMDKIKNHLNTSMKLLFAVEDNDFKDIFLKLVDPDDVDDYYRHVKEPMCLEYVQHKIEHDMYESNKQFIGDLQQIVDNAREYNNPEDSSGAEVLEEANKLEKWINEVGVKEGNNQEITEAFSWVKEYRDRNGLKSPFVRYQKLDEVMKLAERMEKERRHRKSQKWANGKLANNPDRNSRLVDDTTDSEDDQPVAKRNRRNRFLDDEAEEDNRFQVTEDDNSRSSHSSVTSKSSRESDKSDVSRFNEQLLAGGGDMSMSQTCQSQDSVNADVCVNAEESPRENSCVKNSPELKVEVSSLPGSPTQLNEDLLKSNSMPSAPYMRACEPLVICDQKKVDFLYDLVVQKTDGYSALEMCQVSSTLNRFCSVFVGKRDKRPLLDMIEAYTENELV